MTGTPPNQAAPNHTAPTRLEKRIRVAALLIAVGLLIESGTLVRTTPGSFIAFAFLGVGFVVAGIAFFLISLVTVRP